MVWWATVSPGWSGEHQFHLVVLGDFGWSGWYPGHLVDWIGQVDINADSVVRLTTFLPDWPGWLSEPQCHLLGILGLISQMSISVNWRAGWHGWMTFNLLCWVTWSSHLGWQEILCYRWTLLSTGWLGWSSEIFVDDMVWWPTFPSWPVWLGEHHCQMSGLGDSSFTGLVRWAPLSMVWLVNQQLCMVGLVCKINSSFTCLAYLVEWTVFNGMIRWL